MRVGLGRVVRDVGLLANGLVFEPYAWPSGGSKSTFHSDLLLTVGGNSM
jgi:hypothetical protein